MLLKAIQYVDSIQPHFLYGVSALEYEDSRKSASRQLLADA
jgi:hypothetical protein